MLLKAFVGPEGLFLGQGCVASGLIEHDWTNEPQLLQRRPTSALLFIFIAFIALYSFLPLVYTKFVVLGNFRDIGGALDRMRYLILGSITVSQIGFVSAYIIFASQNIQALVISIAHCLKLVPIQHIILAPIVVSLPLVVFGHLPRSSSTRSSSSVSYTSSARKSPSSPNAGSLNPKDFSLFVGVSVYTFEDIGMVIHITDTMHGPRKLPKVLTGVKCIMLVLFAARAGSPTCPSAQRCRPSSSSTSTRRASWCNLRDLALEVRVVRLDELELMDAESEEGRGLGPADECLGRGLMAPQLAVVGDAQRILGGMDLDAAAASGHGRMP
uniref:Amino acid transporter transmembrane domain-containing protein n=1 Tax=Mycena chlorophos TaxID=658473 RepID=A0ABQ0L5X0_MYCCL|nr:predicted protein [Mycena chlorophos]